MSLNPTNLKISKATLWSAQNVGILAEAVIQLSQAAARKILSGRSPTAITNNSGGSTSGPLVLVPTASVFNYGGGATYAPRAGFNTAIGAVDNAIQTLASYLNTNVFTPLAATDVITLDAGTVTANTVPVITQSLTGVDGAADQATNTITLANAAPANGDTVVVNGTTYTFQTALTNVAGNVLIGASLTTAAANLQAAITAGAGAGTVYAAATVANTTVTATNPSAGVVNLTAITGGTAGNAYTLTRTFATGVNCVLGGATFSGGNQDSAMMRSDMNAAIVSARNNLATLVKAYNQAATFINSPTIMDNTGGVANADPTLTIPGFLMVNQVTATNTVLTANTSATDCAALSDANNALTVLANDISYVAAQIGSSLLYATNLAVANSVLIVQ